MIKTVLKEFGLKKDSKWGEWLRPSDTGVTRGQDKIHKEDMVKEDTVKKDAINGTGFKTVLKPRLGSLRKVWKEQADRGQQGIVIEV